MRIKYKCIEPFRLNRSTLYHLFYTRKEINYVGCKSNINFNTKKIPDKPLKNVEFIQKTMKIDKINLLRAIRSIFSIRN